MEIREFSVRSFDLDHLDLFWKVMDTREDPFHYVFHIYKSVDGPSGPFRKTAELVHNTYVFRDPDVHLIHKWRKYYYKIRVINTRSGEEKEYGPEWYRMKPDLVALEVARREQLAFREFIGTKALLFSSFTSGPRCSQCWKVTDRGNTIGRSTQQGCASCFDTTFVGGYSTPNIIYPQIDPSPLTLQQTDISKSARIDTSARLSNFPPVGPDDMIVDAENNRWNVEKVTGTKKLGAVVRQELTLHMIPKGDVRYKVPVTLEEPYAPAREFTRPMTIHASQEGA